LPGINFGGNKKRDMGDRREAAEKVLSKKMWEHCGFCQHWNTENVIKTFTVGETTSVYENSGCLLRDSREASPLENSMQEL